MKLIIEGNLITPIITKTRHFIFKGCKASITQPRRRYYTKISTTKPMFPYSFICYLGKIQMEYRNSSSNKLIRKLTELLRVTNIGRFRSEGLGLVQWAGGRIENSEKDSQFFSHKRKLRIRRGLPLKLSEDQQELLTYALLHDFFHTPKHKSKIYIEPQLEDNNLIEKLRKHHEQTEDPLIKTFQYYDRLAARITRKIRSPITSRYTWQAKRLIEKIDFKKLAQEIKEVTKTNIWNLYAYIYQSKELRLLNESMNHGHCTLRYHLLVIANLIVQDLKNKKWGNLHKKRLMAVPTLNEAIRG